jgi:hypothetical protein
MEQFKSSENNLQESQKKEEKSFEEIQKIPLKEKDKPVLEQKLQEKSDVERIQQLRSELGLVVEQPQKQEYVEPLNTAITPELAQEFKRAAEGFSDSTKHLGQLLAERANAGLAELIDENDIIRIKSVADGISEIDIRTEEDFVDVSRLLEGLKEAVSSIGSMRPRIMIEEPENLSQIAYVLGQLTDDLSTLHHSFSSMNTAESRRTNKYIEDLGAVIDERRVAILRKKQAFENYFGS